MLVNKEAISYHEMCAVCSITLNGYKCYESLNIIQGLKHFVTLRYSNTQYGNATISNKLWLKRKQIC